MSESGALILAGILAVLVASGAVRRHAGVGSVLRDFLTYMTIAVLIAGAAVLWGIYTADHGFSPDAGKKIAFILISTGCIFGVSSKQFWRFKRRPEFWLELLVLLCVHVAVFSYLLSRVAEENISFFWLLLAIPETVIIHIVLAQSFPLKRAELQNRPDK